MRSPSPLCTVAARVWTALQLLYTYSSSLYSYEKNSEIFRRLWLHFPKEYHIWLAKTSWGHNYILNNFSENLASPERSQPTVWWTTLNNRNGMTWFENGNKLQKKKKHTMYFSGRSSREANLRVMDQGGSSVRFLRLSPRSRTSL
jgi:hypothetical protein